MSNTYDTYGSIRSDLRDIGYLADDDMEQSRSIFNVRANRRISANRTTLDILVEQNQLREFNPDVITPETPEGWLTPYNCGDGSCDFCQMIDAQSLELGERR